MLTQGHVSAIIARMKALLLSITLSLVLLSACTSQPAPSPLATSTAVVAITPAASATSIVSPSPTATATPQPTLTFTPTPQPDQALREARQALHDGDFSVAIHKYQALIDGAPNSDHLEEALIDRAYATARSGEPSSAIDLFTQFIAQHPKSDRVADAWFHLGELHFERAAYADAITAYQNYLKLRDDLLPDFVNEQIGDSRIQLGDAANAAKSYEEALSHASGTSNVANLREKLALAYRQLGQPQNALAQYDAILSFAQQRGYRASIMLQAGQTLLDTGETQDGLDRFTELVNTYPEQNEAYQALLALVNAEVPVYEFQRGLVDYYASQYDAAIAAFERFIAVNEDHGNAHYYIGLSYKGAGNIGAALTAFDEIIDDHPEASRWGDAWIEKANTQAVGGDIDGAVKTLTTFAKENPTASQAPTALWNAAGLLERSGEYQRAIALNLQLQDDYPSDTHASEALFDAGLDAFRIDDDDAAINAWRTLSNTYPLSDLHSAALLWQGKVANDRTLLSQLAASDAYYGLRAGDILSGTNGLPFVSGSFDVDPDEGRAEAEQWLASWLQVPPESLRSLPAEVINDPRFKRGTELWQLGKLAEGKAEFQALRDAYSDQPAVLYPLAVHYRDIGLYYPSIVAAASLIRQSPAGSIENAPLFLQRLVYPIYYTNLIIPEAQAANIDPMIIFSLMRAESLFDGAVTSSAAAGGLMQIIPPTGEQIARDLRWSNYQQSDLYRPFINVKFGVYYLRRYGLDFLDQDMYAAWAAYNGGPGNAQRWKENSNGDTDLFVENISLGETRLYIDRLRENLEWYQRLYRQ
jgi:soluble lytic murein transglycosylase